MGEGRREVQGPCQPTDLWWNRACPGRCPPARPGLELGKEARQAARLKSVRASPSWGEKGAILRLTREEESMLAGVEGEAVRLALEQQIKVGDFFGAEDFVPVASAHVHSEMETSGEAGLAFLEKIAALGAKVRVPTTSNPRSVDFAHWRQVGQEERHVELERRLVAAFARLGVQVVDTCINYQSITPPRFGQHLAWGDTGTVAFANSVAGARSNFEAGPAALTAALTGRVPRYGYHLPEQRLGTVLVEVHDQPQDKADWGALGCVVGREVGDYWQVPVFDGIESEPSVDDLKQLGASLASYGSLPMFHLVGVTPEARTREEAFGGREPARRLVLEPGALEAAYRSYLPESDKVELVVFSAPQLSLDELKNLAVGLEGKNVHPEVKLLATTNYANYGLAERLGYVKAVEDAGGTVLAGVCFYLMTPNELREKYGYRSLVTNSAKLANIISGYGYVPVLRPTAVCLWAAVEGRLPW